MSQHEAASAKAIAALVAAVDHAQDHARWSSVDPRPEREFDRLVAEARKVLNDLAWAAAKNASDEPRFPPGATPPTRLHPFQGPRDVCCATCALPDDHAIHEPPEQHSFEECWIIPCAFPHSNAGAGGPFAEPRS